MVLTHISFLLISVATGGAWIFYFADAPTLLKNFVTFQAPFVAYSTVAILTATTYVFGGLMREQVCIYMCPWPRIQAAMLDEDSLVVTYNDWRGEPRSRTPRRRRRASLSAIASTAMPAWRSARWASTSATASSSNASPARCASMPAITSWTSWARSAA
jgi:polyferredoxin